MQQSAAQCPGRPCGWRVCSTVYLVLVIVIGFVSAFCLLLVYSLNTWLPKIMLPIMGQNGIARIAAGPQRRRHGRYLYGSTLADKHSPQRIVALGFLVGALAMGAIGMIASTIDVRMVAKAGEIQQLADVSGIVVALLLLTIAITGLGTSGTQTLIYGPPPTTTAPTSVAPVSPGRRPSVVSAASSGRSSAPSWRSGSPASLHSISTCSAASASSAWPSPLIIPEEQGGGGCRRWRRPRPCGGRARRQVPPLRHHHGRGRSHREQADARARLRVRLPDGLKVHLGISRRSTSCRRGRSDRQGHRPGARGEPAGVCERVNAQGVPAGQILHAVRSRQGGGRPG